MFLFTIQANRR